MPVEPEPLKRLNLTKRELSPGEWASVRIQLAQVLSLASVLRHQTMSLRNAVNATDAAYNDSLDLMLGNFENDTKFLSMALERLPNGTQAG